MTKLLLLLVLFTPSPILAQTGDSGAIAEPVPATLSKTKPAIEPTGTTDPAVAPASTSTSGAVSAPRPAPITAPASAPKPATTSTPLAPRPANPQAPTPVTTIAPTTPTPSSPIPTTPQKTSTNPILWVILALLATLPFGFIAGKLLKKKKGGEGGDEPGCFNLKKLLEEKLKELTNVRGHLESKAKDIAKEAVRDTVKNSKAGDLLAAVEKAEKEYNRIKKLYEECVINFEKRAFKGVVIKKSLSDERILEKLKVNKTEREGDEMVYHVSVGEKQLTELSQSLTSGPWYIHLRQSEKNIGKIIFKDRIFTIQSGDKSTWTDATAYGKTLGIPEQDLDFATDQKAS
ncbi:MAG: hypothetical protein AAB552_01230 [Patescibacteria group bacterium]